jgi:hypothetical protein
VDGRAPVGQVGVDEGAECLGLRDNVHGVVRARRETEAELAELAEQVDTGDAGGAGGGQVETGLAGLGGHEVNGVAYEVLGAL